MSRLIDMGVERFLLAPMLRGLMAQRLVRRLCPSCRAPARATEAQSALLFGKLEAGAPISKPVGCDACNGRGYAGRQALYEVIESNAELERAVNDGVSEAEITRIARKTSPGILLDGIEKVSQGVTTVEEVVRVVRDETATPAADPPLTAV